MICYELNSVLQRLEMISVCFIDLSSLTRTEHFFIAGLFIPLLYGVVHLEFIQCSRKVEHLSLNFMRLLVLLELVYHVLFATI